VVSWWRGSALRGARLSRISRGSMGCIIGVGDAVAACAWSGVGLRQAQVMTKMKTVLQLLQRALVRVLRILFLLAVVMGIGVGVLYTWVHITVLSTLPKDIKELRWYRPQSSCQVYAANGALLDEFYVERRIWVPLDELPPHVWQAFVAAEDRRFFKHPGVDVIGMGRALVANVLEGTIVQGGSTLTQQLVKNIVVGRERSYERKLKEVVLAWRLERELKKAEILELYINYVYLG
jgi:penicillin-binding protein 1A